MTDKYLKYVPNLTKQEINVGLLISQGFSNKEILEKLFISESTLKTYLNNLYSKLYISNKKFDRGTMRVKIALIFRNEKFNSYINCKNKKNKNYQKLEVNNE